MSGPELSQSTMIARISLLATLLVLAILATSAYLRLTATETPCSPSADCAAAQQEVANDATPGQRFARLGHRLSASTVAVLALLVAFVTWTSRTPLLRRNRGLSIILLLLVLFLAVLGAVTRSTYTPAVTLGNVLGSNALAGIFWWIWLQMRTDASAMPVPVRKRHTVLAVAAACLAVLHIAFVALGGIALNSSVSVSVPLSLTHNLLATILFLASLWWLSRNLSPPD
jgi:heme A synthase